MQEIIKSVKKEGRYKIDKWLDDEDIILATKIINEIDCKKGETRGVFTNTQRANFVELLKFQFNKKKQRDYFFNLAKKLNLKKISDEILEHPSKLIRFDCYIVPVSNNPVLDWHFDNAYSGKQNIQKFIHPDNFSLKFFFYLTDVQTNNGCLSYIPESHIIAYVLRKGIYSGEISYTPYWSIEQFRKTIQIKKNYDYIQKNIGSNSLDRFIENTKSENLTDNKFDLSVKKGGAVIFNEGGAHRGSKTSKTHRLALRFFFKKDIKGFN